MNDTEREQWVVNDEGLYLWYKSSRLPLRLFVRSNRKAITEAINRALGK